MYTNDVYISLNYCKLHVYADDKSYYSFSTCYFNDAVGKWTKNLSLILILATHSAALLFGNKNMSKDRE